MSSASGFGTLLRRFRLAAGLSQEALAERAGVSANAVGALERGHRRTPHFETISLLAGALALDGEQRRDFETAARSGAAPRVSEVVTIGPWASSKVSNLPTLLTTFVGRKTELEEISALVGNYRMVTLTGAGGAGKTRLALQVARPLKDSATGGVAFVDLAPLADPSLVSTAIASTLGVQEVPGRPLSETLLAYLKNKPLLLVLDNCEHVLSEVGRVAEYLLSNCQVVRILATSREPIKAAGERAYRLPSLTIRDAVDLFVDRATAIDYRFALTAENLLFVERLCRRLDGMPLAIELAAARVNVLPVKTIIEKLDAGFALLGGAPRTALPRQQTMRATIEWSYSLLSTQERRVLERLSVFAGSCTLEAAESVVAIDGLPPDQVLDLVASLVDKSLLVADLDGSRPRYRMLESFREFAREKVEERGELQALARRHAVATLEFMEQIEPYRHADFDRWTEENVKELDNLRAALQWSLNDRHDVLLGQQIAGRSMVSFVPLAFMEGQRWALCAAGLIDQNTPAELAAALTYDVGVYAYHLGEYERALPLVEDALRRWREVGNEYEASLSQTACGWVLTGLGRSAEAVELLEEALRVRRGFSDNRHGWALRGLAAAYAAEGNFVAASRYAGEALQLYLEHYNKAEAAWAYGDLSEYEYCSGNADAALSNGLRMLDTAKDAHSIARIVASAHNCIASSLIALNRHDEAAEHARKALGIAEEHKEASLGEALLNVAAIAALRAPCDAARITGFLDSRATVTGSTRRLRRKQQYDGIIDVLRKALNGELMNSLLAEGAAMTESGVIDLAKL